MPEKETMAHQQKKLWHSTDTLNDIKDWVDSANTGLQAVAEVSVEDPVVEAAVDVVDAVVEIGDAIVEAFLNNQMGNPTPVNIPWDKVIAGGVHWKGNNGEDVIWMKGVPKAGETPTLNFTQDKGKWWKAIVAFNKKDCQHQWAEVCVVSGDNYQYHLNMNKSVATDNFVVLSKAKFLGVHTNMYLINNWADAPDGYDYTIYWVKD